MCRWRSCLTVVAVLFSALTGMFAEESSCVHRTLPVAVLDANGRVIHGLSPSDFSAKVHGRDARIISISLDKRPHRIVILLDASGSMGGPKNARAWDLAGEIASQVAEANLQNAPMALIIFSHKVLEQVDFAQGAPAVRQRLKEIRADASYVKKNVRGDTTIFDAMMTATSLLDIFNSADSIYLISDGEDNQSRFKAGDVTHALGLRSVRLYVSLFEFMAPTVSNRPAGEEVSLESIIKLSIESGGLISGPWGKSSPNGTNYNVTKDERKALSFAVTRLYGAMTNNDLLQIELPQTIQKWERLSIELSADKKALYKNLVIAYPRELAPCNPLSH
jgi:hypothetical protein